MSMKNLWAFPGRQSRPGRAFRSNFFASKKVTAAIPNADSGRGFSPARIEKEKNDAYFPLVPWIFLRANEGGGRQDFMNEKFY